MQYVYSNTYRNYAVHEIYEEFERKSWNYPKEAVDVFVVSDARERFFQLNRYPLEYTRQIVVNVYWSEEDYNSWTIETTLTEWTHYNIDYDLWVFNFVSTYNPIPGKYIEIIYQRCKINLWQFVTLLNEWIRNLNKYFPTKWIIEYTGADAGLDPNEPQEIDKLDVTGLPFIDINTCREDITAKQEVPMQRKWQWIVFNQKKVQIVTDYWLRADEVTKQPLPIWIEWNLKPDRILRNRQDIDMVKNSVFRFAELWISALILYIRIEMYIGRLEYNEDINISTLKLNTQSIYALVRELKAQLASLVGDSSISKWFYPRGERNEINNTLSSNAI